MIKMWTHQNTPTYHRHGREHHHQGSGAQIIQRMFIVLLSIGLCAALRNSQQDADPTTIENLTAQAILSDGNALQLHVQFQILTNDADGRRFDVRITPDVSSERCTSRKPCIEYGISANTTEVLLPRDPMLVLEYRECNIELGCVYDVRVESNNRVYSRNITYRVPDCVDGECLCAHGERLPMVHVSSSIQPPDLHLFWNISGNYQLPFNVSIDKMSISVGRQNNPSLKWGGPYETLFEFTEPLVHDTVPHRSTGAGSPSVSRPAVNFPSGRAIVRHQMVAGSRYSVRMAVVDSEGCRGPTGNITFTTPAPAATVINEQHRQAEQTSGYVWLVAFLVIVCVVLFVFVPILLHILRNARQAKAINSWRGVYHNVPAANAGGMQHIVMQDNFLYVDKDILEARSRGDADMLEVPHASVTLGREIGKGAFGRVFIARADNICGRAQTVAVKQLKKRPTTDELEEFLSEILIMKSVSRHPNICALLGCCTIKQPLLMIMEFVGCGDLLQYLRQVRGKHEARSALMAAAHRGQRSSSGGGSHSQHSTSVSSDVFGSTHIGTISDANELMQTNHHHSHSAASVPFGRYLDLVHRTSSTTSTSESTYITETDNFPAVRPSVTETLYTMLSQSGGVGGTARSNVSVASSANSLEYVLDHNELHNFATQIARGMRHLHEHQITHRDLAARNILIDENKTLKISDFGLSRSGIYVNTRNKKVPLRWLSVEAMRDHLYSGKSDVWAFGVLLWEIGTLGGFPYPTVSNHELLTYLIEGRRLERPENCSEHLYRLMLACWSEAPADRPEFADIVQHLEPTHGRRVYVDFNELRKDYTFPPTREQVLLGDAAVSPSAATTSAAAVATGGANATTETSATADGTTSASTAGRRDSRRTLMGMRLPRRRSSETTTSTTRTESALS